METLTGIMIAGFIAFSGQLIAAGELEVCFLVLSYYDACLSAIRSLATLNNDLPRCYPFKRISSVIDKEITIKEDDNLPSLKINNANIAFQKVFKYETTKNITVKDIDLSIEGGTIAAFVGHSGAVNAILNLLPRFYDPQRGSIKIDGQDISKVRLSSLRKNISLVSQDTILFDATIKENIAR